MSLLRDESKSGNWKSTTYVAGGLVGLVIGIVAAHLYARTAEEHTGGRETPGPITTADAFRIALTLVGLVRQISDLGARSPDRK